MSDIYRYERQEVSERGEIEIPENAAFIEVEYCQTGPNTHMVEVSYLVPNE